MGRKEGRDEVLMRGFGSGGCVGVGEEGDHEAKAEHEQFELGLVANAVLPENWKQAAVEDAALAQLVVEPVLQAARLVVQGNLVMKSDGDWGR